MADQVVFKIVSEELWREAEAAGSFAGSPVDLQDGFIHFSSKGQVAETARRYYAGRTGLLLIAIDGSKLGDALRFEPSRGGELFPHLYAPLALSAVLWKRPMPLGPDGEHLLAFDSDAV